MENTLPVSPKEIKESETVLKFMRKTQHHPKQRTNSLFRFNPYYEVEQQRINKIKYSNLRNKEILKQKRLQVENALQHADKVTDRLAKMLGEHIITDQELESCSELSLIEKFQMKQIKWTAQHIK